MDDWAVAQARVALLNERRLTTTERIRAYRVLAEVEPTTYLPRLAEELGRLTYEKDLQGKPEASIALAEEAVEAARRIPETHPERPAALMGALDTCQWHLYESGRHQDAFALRAEMASISRSEPSAGETGLGRWALGLAENGRYEEAAAAYAELDRLYPTKEPSYGAAAWRVVAWAAASEAAGDVEGALAKFADLVELERVNVAADAGPLTCLVYALVHHARLLAADGRLDGAVTVLEEAEPVCAELAATGERRSWSGYQTSFWAVLLAASARADERFPPAEPRPHLGAPVHTWAPHVRGWMSEEECAALRDEIEVLRPGADAAPEEHLGELVTLHRRLTVRCAVRDEFRPCRFPEPSRPLFDEGIALARRLRPRDDGIALVRALLDRSGLLLAGNEYDEGHRDFLEALSLLRSLATA
ncbi:hypothetical protein BZB76_2046 [Actinomadura pelletieri DSM 43383]|uniref:Tetratricopeptide repeat protein n=1 Tax=Actinomadura pelletieri DSM 43383 TaxID=1120940 RepID=A0A495QT48_9ACTN|nr:hypothetical protein [Actinomadura pelletieri]RKS76689.1 hypothetical protein BZB76_2046 [Actinomadura pelletieri DSM 43383]